MSNKLSNRDENEERQREEDILIPSIDILNSMNDRVGEQLKELELSGEMPSIALQAAGRMLCQHAELMSNHAEELQSILTNPDESSWPWGSMSCELYDIQQYGPGALERSYQNDPIHEVTALRMEMEDLARGLCDTERNVKRKSDNIFKGELKPHENYHKIFMELRQMRRQRKYVAEWQRKVIEMGKDLKESVEVKGKRKYAQIN